MSKKDGSRARRPLWRRPFLIAFLLLVGWGAWSGFEMASAARDGLGATRLARGAEDSLSEGKLNDPAPLADLRLAQARFERARDSFSSVPLKAVGVLPVVGRQVRELRALSVGAAQLADVSADTVEAAQGSLKAERSTGPQRVTMLRALGDIAGSGAKRAATIQRTDGRNLVGPVFEQHEEFNRDLERAEKNLGRASAGAKAMADLLGGPRRYVVLASNNAEMRSGSGMFNSIGALETTDGKLTLLPFIPASDLKLAEPGAPISGDFADRWGWLGPGREWRNLAVSPRFDQTGPLAAAMWEASGRGKVDGVIAVDPVFLKAVLEAVGPVEAAGHKLDSSNVVDRILFDQYVDHASGPRDQEARREELGLVAKSVLEALETRSWDPSELGRAVADAAQGRHVLAWSARPDEQRGWEAAGIDGAMAEDSLMLSVLNRGGNKLDQFLNIEASLECVPTDGRVDGVLTVRLRNEVPKGVPQYVAGPDPDSGVGEGVYLGILAVTLPGTAVKARIEGVDQLIVSGADGPTRIVAAEVKLARGEERTYVVRFDLPAGPGSLEVEATARVPIPDWSAQKNTTKWTERPQKVNWGD